MISRPKGVGGEPAEEWPKAPLVSAGAEEASSHMRTSSPAALNQNFATGRAFGAIGTPSAMLVDSEGTVASELAVGARLS